MIDKTILGILDDIRRLNYKEDKDITLKIIKFNEEYGEMSAEVLNFLVVSYKEYDREHLKEEMADALQCLFSVYLDIEDKTGISVYREVLPMILEKNKKWEKGIDKKQNNE